GAGCSPTQRSRRAGGGAGTLAERAVRAGAVLGVARVAIPVVVPAPVVVVPEPTSGVVRGRVAVPVPVPVPVLVRGAVGRRRVAVPPATGPAAVSEQGRRGAVIVGLLREVGSSRDGCGEHLAGEDEVGVLADDVRVRRVPALHGGGDVGGGRVRREVARGDGPQRVAPHHDDLRRRARHV